MDATFVVEWKRLVRPISRYFTVSIMAGSAGVMAARYVFSGFDYDRTFDPMPLPMFLLFMAATPGFSVGVSYLFASLYTLARVDVSNGEISGMGFWRPRNRVPLSDINKLRRFNNCGVSGLVLISRNHGRILILDKTEHLPQLLALLSVHLPNAGELDGAEQVAVPKP